MLDGSLMQSLLPWCWGCRCFALHSPSTHYFHGAAAIVQGNATAEQLEKDDKAGTVPKELYNNYTVITYSNGEYSQAAYATYFKDEIADIVGLFDRWISGTGPSQWPLQSCSRL